MLSTRSTFTRFEWLEAFTTTEASNLFTRFLFALALAWFASWIGLNMESLGFRIAVPEPASVVGAARPNLGIDYAMGVLWWVVFACALLLFAKESRRMLVLAWAGKFVVVLVLMLFYEQHYGLDSYTYFWATRTGQHWMYPGVDFSADMLPTFKPAYHIITGDGVLDAAGEGGAMSLGSENTIRFTLLVGSVTGPFYHAIKVAFAFFGLLGVWLFYRAVVLAVGRPWPSVFYVLAFFPSILFWSSTLGKDPLQFLFLGLYAYGAAMWFVEGRLGAIPWIGIGLAGTYMLRPWICMIAVAALGLTTMLGRCRPWQIGMAVTAQVVLVQQMFSIFLQGGTAHLVLDIMESARGVAEGYGMEGASGEKGIDLSSQDALATAFPLAFFSGLFRPLPYDITNPFTALAAVENTVVLVLAVVALCRVRLGYLRDPLVLWPFLYTVLWTSFHGFIVMVNFGSGVRYKLQVWPFFLLMLLSLTYSQGRAFLTSRLPARRADFRH